MSEFGTATARKVQGVNLDALAGTTFRTEAEFQSAVFKLARGAGFLCYHTRDSRKSEAGFPDCVMVHPWRKLVIVAELKVGTNKCTPAQVAWLEAFRAVGLTAVEWRPEQWNEIVATISDGV